MKYFFLLLLIVASIGVFVAFIVPEYHTVQSIKADVAADNANLATATQLEKSRESLIAQYNTIQKTDLDNIQTLLPDSVDNIRLIIQMNALATKDGLSSLRSVEYNPDDVPIKNADGSTTTPSDANNTNVSDPTSTLPYGQFVISFETSGQYSNFLSFLSDMEKNLRLVDVTDVIFSGPADGSTSAAAGLTYKVTLKTYWLKQ